MGICLSARIKSESPAHTDCSKNSSNSVAPTPRTEVDILQSPNLKSFNFFDLKVATRNFRPESVRGGGGFGSVFKGWMTGSMRILLLLQNLGLVWLLQSRNSTKKVSKAIESCCEFGGQFSHPNLVKLIEHCLEGDYRLLVYKSMPRGSLKNHLFRSGSNFQPLSWNLRLKVALGAAKGLAFLHSSEAKVIYRGFKTSNILLDASYNAKLSNFGLVKDWPTGDKSHVSTRVMGTYGCAAPEYLATGRRAIHKEQKEGEAKSLSWRIEKLSKGDSVSSAFRSWMGDGLPIHRGDVFHMINRLRRLKSIKRALEVMEWVIRERPYKPEELDYSYLLEFTMKFHGVEQAETLVSRIPSEFQNELLYNNLVLGCLEKGLIRLSLAYMKKMRDLGHSISYLAFNRLIILHSSPSRRKAIRKILIQMKADKVVCHVSTFNILMKIEASDHNIEGLVRVFSDMKRMTVEPNEISYCILAVSHAVARLYTACEAYVEMIKKLMTGDNWSTLDILVILYGYLRNEKELERTWTMIQELPHVRSKSFLLTIEAFGKIGNLGRAEELWLEMVEKKGLKSTEQYNSMIGVYCKKGLVTKATKLYKDIEKNGCKANAITFRHLALGCSRAGLLNEVIRTLELGSEFLASAKIRSSTPWLETTLSIMEAFAENGDVENVEKVFEELKNANYTRYSFVYNVLIKVYVKAKIYEPNLVRRMILGGCRPDAETYSLMKIIEQFKP